jgi:hypothetical protein
LEDWNARREYKCSVDLYFGNREGDEARRLGNTTSIAQEAILQLQAPSIPTLLQTLLQRKACAAKEESSCLQQQQTMVFRTSSSPKPKAILEKKSSRLDSSLQRQTIIVRSSSNFNPNAILAFLALVGQKQCTREDRCNYSRGAAAIFSSLFCHSLASRGSGGDCDSLCL